MSKTPSARQDAAATVTYGGAGWKAQTTTSAWGGTVKYNATAGRTSATTFTGTAVAFVTTKAKDRGKVTITLDGKVVATLDLYSATTSSRVIAWSSAALKAGSHTVTVTVLGTKNASSTGTRVDVDGFMVLG